MQDQEGVEVYSLCLAYGHHIYYPSSTMSIEHSYMWSLHITTRFDPVIPKLHLDSLSNFWLYQASNTPCQDPHIDTLSTLVKDHGTVPNVYNQGAFTFLLSQPILPEIHFTQIYLFKIGTEIKHLLIINRKYRIKQMFGTPPPISVT